MTAARPDNAFLHRIGVTWGECDPAKIAYTGHIPAWALRAINAWWDHHVGAGGWYHLELDRNVGTPFVHLSMDFTSPITPRHELICHVWPARLGKTSIAFRVDGEQDGTLCFSGRFVSVFTVADQFRKQTVPQDIKEIVSPLLGPDE